jgi:hypothetical protein
MVALEQLRYVRLVAGDLGHAADFAQRVLGLEPIDRTRELATFRSDFRDYTLAFASGTTRCSRLHPAPVHCPDPGVRTSCARIYPGIIG